MTMSPRAFAFVIAALLALPASAAAQDPAWKLIRPDVTWDNHWTLEPPDQRLHSLLDDPGYIEERPVVSSDRAVASRPKQRFAVGFSDIEPGVERFAGGQVWIYVGIKKRTRMDFAIRTRRDGRLVTLIMWNRVTPPIVIVPEDPPVGRHGFRGWLPITLPAMSRDDANRLSLTVRISPSSPKHSLSRVYAAFAELYPET
jgi:hypothetical protein